jgi:uncharacterized RDD family membrane protein YckC
VLEYFQVPVYAGFWIRFLAYLIDSLLLAVVFCPLSFIFGLIIVAAEADEAAGPTTFANLLINLVSVVGTWLYSSWLESSTWQGTVGKKLLGLKVTDLNGNRISFGKATGRHFGKILSGLILGIGFIMVAFTDKKQGLHDMLAGTLVVKDSASGGAYPQPPPPPDFGYRGGTLSG